MKCIKQCFLFFLTLGMMLSCHLAKANDFSAADLKRMSVFLSNFSELGMTNVNTNMLKDNPELYLQFGIWHNFINNYSNRIKPIPNNNSGLMSVDKKYIQESVKKYFDASINTWPSTKEYTLKGDKYIFTGASGELILYAKVTKVDAQSTDGRIVMKGYYYNADDEEDKHGTFKAVAKPHKWQGKNTWALISLESKD